MGGKKNQKSKRMTKTYRMKDHSYKNEGQHNVLRNNKKYHNQNLFYQVSGVQE